MGEYSQQPRNCQEQPIHGKPLLQIRRYNGILCPANRHAVLHHMHASVAGLAAYLDRLPS